MQHFPTSVIPSIYIYRSAIFPWVNYYSAIWDPHQECYKSELENVQKFAGRVITRQWKSTYPNILAQLNWLPLHVRRRHQKLKACYNWVLNNLSIIPASVFIPHPHPSTHIHHSKPLKYTHDHKFSFFINIISTWNSLPDFIIMWPLHLQTKLFKQNQSLLYIVSYPCSVFFLFYFVIHALCLIL